MIFKKPNRKIIKCFLHCSANSNPKWGIKDLRKSHLDRGFNEIGYHFFIDRTGILFIGRSLEETPAAQKGFNTGSIAICLHGGQNDKDDFTEMQLIKCKELCIEIHKAYSGKITFHGHCEVEPAKTCPVFNYNKLLNLQNGQICI